MTYSPRATVAFRHLIEDGLSVLTTNDIKADRRKCVLDGLRRLLLEAVRGSELINQHRLVAGSIERNAHESYSFIEQHLKNQYDEKAVSTASIVFDQLFNDVQISSDAQKDTVKLLKELLASINTEGNASIPFEPEEIRFAE